MQFAFTALKRKLSLLTGNDTYFQERLAVEVAALDKAKPAGVSKGCKGNIAAAASMQGVSIQTNSVALQTETRYPAADSNPSPADLQSTGMQTDSNSDAFEMCNTSTQTDSDSLQLELADLKVQLEAASSENLTLAGDSQQLMVHQTKLKVLSQRIQELQADNLGTIQKLSVCQDELLSVTQEMQMLKAEQLTMTSLLATKEGQLHDLQQHCNQQVCAMESNMQGHSQISEQHRSQINFYEQAFVQLAHKLRDTMAQWHSANISAAQQQADGHLSSKSVHLSTAQQHLAHFDSLYSKLHCQNGPYENAMCPSRTFEQYRPDKYVGIDALVVQMGEQAAIVTQALQAAQTAEVEQLR